MFISPDRQARRLQPFVVPYSVGAEAKTTILISWLEAVCKRRLEHFKQGLSQLSNLTHAPFTGELAGMFLTKMVRWTHLLCGALLCCGCATAQKEKAVVAPKTFRVMSYNIHHGEGVDQRIDLQRIADVIKREKVDIVGLQEIDRGVDRTNRRDLIKELSDLTGMEFYFDRNITYGGGHYGNAVLTRFPMLKKKNTHYQMLRPHEQRGVQQVVMDVHGRKLLFMNTHIDFRPEDDERRMNVKELNDIVASAPDMPIVICGDFNSMPDSLVYAQLKKFLHDVWEMAGKGDGFSFPSDVPDRRIDYIWIGKKSAVKPLKIWVPQTQASDHLPIVAEFQFIE